MQMFYFALTHESFYANVNENIHFNKSNIAKCLKHANMKSRTIDWILYAANMNYSVNEKFMKYIIYK